jgi:hypothetical protein
MKVGNKKAAGKPAALLYKLVCCSYKAAVKPAAGNAAALLARASNAWLPKYIQNIIV